MNTFQQVHKLCNSLLLWVGILQDEGYYIIGEPLEGFTGVKKNSIKQKAQVHVDDSLYLLKMDLCFYFVKSLRQDIT